ncbi:ComF family protein [Corynebacterium terpenotabidum]|uniref:Phosphoribosyltransferase domain-containing protein n=1 Tax=Corynebacterium terpenotabidum Y-11 TaxID=1200352 RepID=S4XI69_9CORY|nr:hypothetical protein [Corynebacterium terpenotabidum]AGP31385.1 hypothetical protein A606_08710 [Corynebacterium terpenotabidum Y-11]
MGIRGWWDVVEDAAELVWRRDCPGCAGTAVVPVAVGAGVCRDCAAALRRPPERVDGTGHPPVSAAGPYGGVHRALVLAAKDHHRPDAVQVLGEVIAGVVRHLVTVGELPDPRLAPVVLLPAPTRPSAARARGGCIVARAAAVAASGLGGDACAVPVAVLGEWASDSVGLSRVRRAGNLARSLCLDTTAVGRVRRLLRTPGAAACLIDDVCTTGATLSGFSLALAGRGVIPRSGVVVARS